MLLVYQSSLTSVPRNLFQKHPEQSNIKSISGSGWTSAAASIFLLCEFTFKIQGGVVYLGTSCWTFLNLRGGMPGRISRCDVKTATFFHGPS